MESHRRRGVPYPTASVRIRADTGQSGSAMTARQPFHPSKRLSPQMPAPPPLSGSPVRSGRATGPASDAEPPAGSLDPDGACQRRRGHRQAGPGRRRAAQAHDGRGCRRSVAGRAVQRCLRPGGCGPGPGTRRGGGCASPCPSPSPSPCCWSCWCCPTGRSSPCIPTAAVPMQSPKRTWAAGSACSPPPASSWTTC